LIYRKGKVCFYFSARFNVAPPTQILIKTISKQKKKEKKKKKGEIGEKNMCNCVRTRWWSVPEEGLLRLGVARLWVM
jgi:hypothetical protein